MSDIVERLLDSHPNEGSHDLSCRCMDAAAEIERLRTELETERMRIVACGVAALGNTEASAAQRIGRDNPYWSASYGDVCDAVDREMALRADVEAMRQNDARYRWLNGIAYAGINRHNECLWCLRGLYEKDGQSFGEAIDAAMVKDKPC